MVCVDFLDHIDDAAADGVEAFAAASYCMSSTPFAMAHRLQFLSGIGVEDRDLAAAAPHEQALVRLVERHGNIVVPLSPATMPSLVFFQRSTTATSFRARLLT